MSGTRGIIAIVLGLVVLGGVVIAVVTMGGLGQSHGHGGRRRAGRATDIPIVVLASPTLVAQAATATPVDTATTTASADTPTPPPTAAPIPQGTNTANIELGTDWSGYAAATNLQRGATGSVTDVQGEWTIPTMHCGSGNPNPAYSSTWVGIDGFRTNTVEQLGTDQNCLRGQSQYAAWFEMYPRDSVYIDSGQMRVQAGDVFFADVKYAGNATFTLSMRNLTSGQNFSVTRTMTQAKLSSAEWVVEKTAITHDRRVYLANFGAVTFTNCQATIDGHTGGIDDPAWKYKGMLIQYRRATEPADVISPVSADGRTFAISWSPQ